MISGGLSVGPLLSGSIFSKLADLVKFFLDASLENATNQAQKNPGQRWPGFPFNN
jgi:hypothetical protein